MITKLEDINWITSDTHFSHDNIVKYCFRPGWDKYGNHNFEIHNDLMIKNWLERVRPDETILHLGDVCFWGSKKEHQEKVEETFAGLPGDKYLIEGANHDNYRKDWYESLGFAVIPVFDLMHETGWKFTFTHYPLRDLKPHQINIHGHIHNNSVTGLTKRHKNVGVDVAAFAPLPMNEIVESCLYRAKESTSRDYDPILYSEGK